jgi:uncharacterized membrane protein
MYCTMWGLHWFWIMPVIFMLLMFLCAASMFRRSGGWRWCAGNRAGWRSFCCWSPEQDSRPGRRSKTPRQILDERYASGEIASEQYERMKRDIGSSQGDS